MKRIVTVAALTAIAFLISSLTAFAAPNKSFSDVDSTYWASKQIHSLANYEIINGGGDGRFRPSDHLTRSELAKLLTEAFALGSTPASLGYSDLFSSHWSFGYVAKAVASDWVNGFPDKTFRPNAPATRAQVAKILTKVNGYSMSSIDTGTSTFKDTGRSYWAYPHIMAAAENGLISGYPDGTFRPNSQITRAEAAALIYRALQNKDYLMESSTVNQITYERYRRFKEAGPLCINVLKVPKEASAGLQLALANDIVASREKLSSMAQRKGAIAGVNADFFSLRPGGPSGLMVDGQLVTSPINNRSYFGILPDKTFFIDRASMNASVTPSITGTRGVISWVNKPREKSSSAIIAYTPLYGPSTLTEDTGTEVTIRLNMPASPNAEIDGTVIDVRYDSRNSPIPADCIVLSAANGSGEYFLNSNIVLGDLVKLDFTLEPNWQSGTSAIGGGPRLIRDGQVGVESEAFDYSQVKGRNARTGIGIDALGNLIIVVVDGKRDYFSIGMTLAEMASDLAGRGAINAMGFDSGGSSALYFDGAIRNYPTDSAERQISNALLFTPSY